MHRACSYKLLMFLLILFFGPVQRALYSVTYVHTSKHSVTILDEQSGEKRTVFADSMVYIHNFSWSDVRLSPSEKYISIHGLRKPEKRFVNGRLIDDTHVLIIIRLDDDSTCVLENAYYSSWAPNWDTIVYVEGENVDNSSDYFVGRQVLLFDLETGKSNRIIEEEYTFFDIAWAKHNGRIYTSSNGVKEYDPDKGRTFSTEYQYCDFAPAGSYYYIPPIEGESGVLYKSVDNSEVNVTSEDIGILEFGLHVHLVEWAMIGNKTLAYMYGSLSLFCIDCSSGVMSKVIPPSPDIDPIGDLVGFRDGRPVWARITGDKAELFYY